MNNIVKTILKISFCFAVVLYIVFAVGIGTLLLNKNDFGYIQLGDKALVNIRESSDKYLKNQLVIVEKKSLKDLNVGEEVFIYKVVGVDRVNAVSTSINKIYSNPDSISVNIYNNESQISKDFVAGQVKNVYDNIGGLISLVQTRWIYFILCILPFCFLLVYEVYSMVQISFTGGESVKLPQRILDDFTNTFTFAKFDNTELFKFGNFEGEENYGDVPSIISTEDVPVIVTSEEISVADTSEELL